MGYTKEQAQIIESTGKIIVSASAGSGKTFVMIERLVSLILKGADVRRVLAVTFTNKAAAQMRDKLRAALLERVASSGGEEKARLKEQLKYLPNADICTIHAFCGRLVRSHFYLADVDAGFRIISPEDAEGKMLASRAMDELFEQSYEAGDEQFTRLLRVYFRKKKDGALRTAIDTLFGSVRGTADYRELLARAGENDCFEEACDFLAQDFSERIRKIFEDAEDLFSYFSLKPKAQKVCGDLMEATQVLQGGLFEMAVAVRALPPISAMPPSTRAFGEEKHKLTRLSDLKKQLKAVSAELEEYADRREELARYADARERGRALADLVLKYDEIYSRLKREAGVLDYDDLEHCALRVLDDPKAGGEMRERYDYVFVDEYQDVNPAQKNILSRICGEQVFFVGDIKQSIYGFRGSRSQYFADTMRDPAFQTLRLSYNFRSAPAVLAAVNEVFAKLSERLGHIDYTPVYSGGGRYRDNSGAVLFHYIPEKEKQEKVERGVYSVMEAREKEDYNAQAQEVVRLVKEELGKEWFDADEDCVKYVSYGDIAVLVRKNTGDAEAVVAALSACDIPVTTTAKVNICSYREIRMLIDWLSYLDNAEQDIPLCSAMLSAIGGFTEDDLVQIRLRFPSCKYFRTAVSDYANKMADGLSARLKAFFAKTERYRTLACVRTAREMLCLLLGDGLEVQLAASKDGARKLSRVRKLLAEAEGSVHAFLRKIARAEYDIGFSESGGEGAVKVQTMHAAKGLEYPVVILASLDASFHGADRDEVMFTERFFVAPRSFDAEKKLVYNTVLRRASAVWQEREELKQEMNLLYVAMTRARYRLHLLFSKEVPFRPEYAGRMSEFFDLAACEDYFQPTDDWISVVRKREVRPMMRAGQHSKEKLIAAYAQAYAFEESTRLPVKSSATELMQQEAPLGFDGERGERLPAASVEEGLAYHAFLQNADFARSAAEELTRMRERGILTEEQLSYISAEKAEQIFSVPAVKAMAGRRIFREQKFLVGLPASTMMNTTARDEVVFQGAVDAYYQDEKGTVLIDYKYSSHSEGAIRQKYALQIALYKKALAAGLHIAEDTIRAVIVNILSCREIPM